MAKLLFKLNGVPDDEADEIREVLDGNEIDYYETSAGSWGLSFAGIWLKQEDQFEQARSLIDEYQEQRYHKVQTERRIKIESGEYPTYWQSVLHSPIKILLVLAFVSAVLYFSVRPFFG
ncbi:MAG: DUF6164 family protein [Kangiellaceae bacterium]|nr:DUF6164 family protein [Kangiellaceae bacterium]MCW9000117.1 DUF6164 family protein [Kangiellaceae bacterium]